MLTDEDQDFLVESVRDAARRDILPRFRKLDQADITRKSNPQDLVTTADLAAERFLTQRLSERFPNALVAGEEAVAATPALRQDMARADLAFVLDPVDGTWNFANGLPLFGVILSVLQRGRPLFGLLYDPVADDWMVANEASASRQVAQDGKSRRLSTAAQRDRQDLSGYAHLYLMPRDLRAPMAARLATLGRAGTLHCSCHEYRMLAQGSVDFCFSGVLNPWDHAAGVLLCQQAGGVARMLDGRPYSAEHTQGYLLSASSEAAWQELRDTFAFLLD